MNPTWLEAIVYRRLRAALVPGVSVTQLAQGMAYPRRDIEHALACLEEKRLVRSTPAEDGRPQRWSAIVLPGEVAS